MTFSRKVVPGLYEEARKQVSDSLVEAQTIAITTDGWTSRATESFVTVTAYDIDSSRKLHNRVLQTRPLHESHTGINIAGVLTSAVEEWRLQRPHRLQPVCSDSAANMAVAVEHANMSPHIKCFAHAINIAAQNVLKINGSSAVDGAFEASGMVVAYFHKSSTANHQLEEKQALLSLPKHTLMIEVKTRWNSTYDMLERYLEQQPAVMAVLMSAGATRSDLDTLSPTDVTTAEQLIAVLQPIKTVTTVLCDASQSTISMVWPLLANLKESMQPRDSDTTIMRRVKQVALAYLDKRYTSASIQRLMMQSSAIDPRFKALPFVAVPERGPIYASLVAMADKVDDSCRERAAQQSQPVEASGVNSPEAERVQQPIEVFTVEGPPAKKSALSSLLGPAFGAFSSEPDTKQVLIEMEMKIYCAKEPLELNGDPLGWWSSHQHMLPYLCKVARHLLCIPATSVPSERVFSTAGDVVTAQRSCLSAEHVDMLVFLKTNAHINV